MTTRQITGHEVNECNAAITIEADAQNPANGNASHHYTVRWRGKDGVEYVNIVDFQDGPIGDHGVNGLTQEVLLTILADRLECFQTSAFANEYNQMALEHILHAREALHARTKERMARNVEGKNIV